jgi:hypothetical protein
MILNYKEIIYIRLLILQTKYGLFTAPWTASVPMLPRTGREAPLIASMCRVLSIAWEFLVFSCVLFAWLVYIIVLHFALPWIS